MNKEMALTRLKGAKIAVIRGDDMNTARAICKTAVQNGIDVLEITFSVPDAPQLIATLRQELPETLIGAGTVLTCQQAERALKSGADFIVSPCTIEEVGAFCKERGVLCILGAATATEAYQAYQSGSDIVKLFPADVLPIGVIHALQAPMPFLQFIPTGGVDPSNIRAWFEGGAYAVGLGGYLTRGIGPDNLDVLAQRCKALIEACGGLK